MSTLTKGKLALALVGVILFGAGIRLDRHDLRWGGMAAVAIAWVLRFARGAREEAKVDDAEEAED